MKLLLLSNNRRFELRDLYCSIVKNIGNVCYGYKEQRHILIARFPNVDMQGDISIVDLLKNYGPLKDYLVQPYFISTDLYLLEINDSSVRLRDIRDKEKVEINKDDIYSEVHWGKFIVADLFNCERSDIKILNHLTIQRGPDFEDQELTNEIVEYLDDTGNIMFRNYFYEGIVLSSGRELPLHDLPENIKRLGFDELDKFVSYINSYKGSASQSLNNFINQLDNIGVKRKG